MTGLRRWFDENRTFNIAQILLSLGGATFLLWLFDKVVSLSPVALVALGLILGGLLLYTTLHLPKPKPRHRPSAPLSLPPLLTPRGRINSLVTEAQYLRRGLPAHPGPNDLAAAIAGGHLGYQYYWRIAGWHARAWQTVQSVAPNLTALYDHNELPAINYDQLRAYLDARIAELQRIMQALPQ